LASEELILELVELIYKAAGDPEGWATVLQRLVQALRGNLGTIHHQDVLSQESSFSALWNLDPAVILSYISYYGARNPFMTTRPELIRTGAVNTNQMLCPDELLLRSEYYNDYLSHLGVRHGLAATLIGDGADSSNISIFRKPNAEPFGEQERKFLLILVPHLQRAFQIHTRIQGLERKADAAADAIDQLTRGVVLLGADGRVLLVNRAATALFASEPALKLTARGLVAAVPSENRQLHQLVQGALTTGKGMRAGGSISISRRGLRRPLHLLVTPLRTSAIHLGKEVPIVAVFISDPDRKPVSESQVFSLLYGLTQAESRLALLLAAGQSLKDAAEQLGVAQSTVRSQLKSIFGKTNTTRQSQLVRLLLLTPALSAQRGFLKTQEASRLKI
jgi:DNA-binding CsgD family transcriptional regulator